MDFKKVGPFGGQGGNYWDDGIYTTIRQLHVNCGSVIDSIQIEYDKNGQFVWSTRHGGTGGHCHEVKLDYPDEYIISISGHHKVYNTGNYVVHSLKIETNKKTYGPFGTEKGNPFSILACGSKIVGFHGGSGIYIDSIGAYVASIPISHPYESVGPFGGQGGNRWDDGAYTSVRQLHVICGTVIDSIQIEYDENGKSMWSTRHGGTGGHKRYKIKLDYPEEFIISISGHHKLYSTGNYVIHSLKIKSNKKMYGPFGTEDGNFFSFPVSSGKIVGFHGRSGIYIDSIGAYVLPIPISCLYESVGPFGGQGGNLWDDGVYTTIRQMEIASGKVIDSICIEYDKHGCSVWSKKHGESTDGKKSIVKLDYPNEFIISISGHHKCYNIEGSIFHIVSSLKIKSNKKAYGPFGTEQGNFFSFPISSGKIVGFHGRCGTFIDSIGAYVVPISNSCSYESVGPFGGQGGTLWDDGIYTTIRQIEIVSGDIIDSIRIVYDRQGYSVWSKRHGKSNGGKKSVVKLDYPNEYLTSISGYYRTWPNPDVIQSLTMQSNKRQYGPFGIGKEEYFSLSSPGNMIIGFHGRSGNYLDAIGAYMEPISKQV